MQHVGIIGIDAATKARNMGLAYGEVRDGRCELFEVEQGRDPVGQIARWIDAGPKTILLAVDAPLGWPDELGVALASHQAGMPLGVPLDQSHRLFRRHADTIIKRCIGKQPLDVGANFIARTAHAILWRLHELPDRCTRTIDLQMAWDPDLRPGCHMIEVYPAATLIGLAAELKGYKAKGAAVGPIRENILEALGEVIQIHTPMEPMITNDDLLDSALCVLAGFDFLSGLAMAPSTNEMAIAQKEGWIWCRGTRTDLEDP